MSFGVEYIIGLIDRFTPVAEKVAKSAKEADAALNKLGKEASAIDGAIGKSAEAMNKLAAANEKAGRATSEFTRMNSRASQDRVRATELEIASLNRIEKLQMGMLERQTARQQLIESGQLKPGRGGSGGREIGIMGGLFGLSMLHNDFTEKWAEFDDEMRRMRGTMAGQLSDSDMQKLRSEALKTARGTIFTGTDIAKIMMAEAERGVPLNEIVQTGHNKGELLGSVIAKQMLGIATATGEDPAKTFETHLAIQRGFELPFSAFPHISDTIARVHQKTGITLKQIETQMGQIGSFAHTAGWSEEQTLGAVGYLAKRGMGQYAGSGLARLISKSQSWSKPAAEFWKSLGIGKEDVIDSKTGGMIAPDKMIQLLQDHTKGMRPADVAEAFTKMFGDRGQKIAAAFASGSAKELHDMIVDLQDIDGLAEKMGVEGSKGGAAGLKKFQAAWENLKMSIGDSGFGDQVGALSSAFGDLFDKIADGPNWMKEATGWTAAGLNFLSSAALPIMALGALGPMIAGLGRITGITAAFTGLRTALAGIAVSGAGGIARLSMAIGGIAMRAVGLSAAASSMSSLAIAARGLMGLTGIGAALIIGYEVVQHWDQIAAAITRTAAALKELAKGNTAPIKQIGEDVGKSLGIDTPKDPRFKTQPHGRFGPGWQGFVPPPADNLAASNAATIKAQMDVKTHIDPIVINPTTANVNVKVDVDASGVGRGQGSGSMPLSATAPRGTTSATAPSNPQVAR